MEDQETEILESSLTSVPGSPHDDGGPASTCTAQRQFRIVSIEDHHLPQVYHVLNDSFSTKRCLFVCRVTETLPELKSRYAAMSAAKRRLGAIAVDKEKNAVLGYVQMATKGMPVFPMNLHKCRDDEMYIEVLGVAPEARGKGVGTALLEWCRDVAMGYDDIQRLTLDALRGNRAIGLYERFGLEIKKVDACDECCGAILVCCLFGRPYGICNEEWGSVEMEMTLDK